MSAELYISDFASNAIAITASVASGVAVAAGGVAIAATAAVGIALAGAGYTAYAVGRGALELGKNITQNVSEFASAIAQDRAITRELNEKYREICEKQTLAPDAERAHNERIISYFNNGTIVSNSRAATLIKGAKSPAEVGHKLIDIQANYTMLEGNYDTLNHLCEELDLDIGEVSAEYRALLDRANTLSIDKLDTAVSRLNQQILKKINDYKALTEQAIREKKFDPQFFQVTEIAPQLFEAIFSSDLAELISNPPEREEKIVELVTQKRLSEIRLGLYDMFFILKDAPGFEEYSDEIIRLIGSTETLAQRKDIPLVDFEYEVGLKLRSFKAIGRRLEQHKGYGKQRRHILLLAEINQYRALLNLDPIEITFSNSDADIAAAEKALEEIKGAYVRNMRAKHTCAQLKLRYTKLNYRHISAADKTVKTPVTTLHRSYFITPDQKNVLCITVNENGQVFERVVGVTIPGLADDKLDVYQAQTKFCNDSKRVLADTFDKDAKIKLDAPDMKYAISEDFSKILPQTVLGRIRDARQARQATASKERTFDR